MPSTQHLLERLDQIGQSLAESGHGLALLGLGSVGLETARLDFYSDLDFFAIVQAGHKADFLHNLDWLARVYPIVYSFMNTVDGHKLLFADGIFCEMAIFEPYELAHIPFAEGRIVWQSDQFDPQLARPQRQDLPEPHPIEWHVGECLTNLYVGLARLARGEVLSATRFIQGYAVDRLVALAPQIETEQTSLKDPFSPERRFEARHPQLAQVLPQFVQGYERNKESAKAILIFLEQHFEVNPAIKGEILKLIS